MTQQTPFLKCEDFIEFAADERANKLFQREIKNLQSNHNKQPLHESLSPDRDCTIWLKRNPISSCSSEETRLSRLE
jgi:hypothetical protein